MPVHSACLNTSTAPWEIRRKADQSPCPFSTRSIIACNLEINHNLDRCRNLEFPHDQANLDLRSILDESGNLETAYIRTKHQLPKKLYSHTLRKAVKFNVTNHPAATRDCPFENAQLRRSGALAFYRIFLRRPQCAARAFRSQSMQGPS